MELFAGSARLTSSLGGEGFDSFGVDHVVAKQASGSILQLDLNDPLSVQHLWRILADPAVRYIHCAPPCGTATRASDIQFPGAPAVLRTEAKPQGIEGLEGINAESCQGKRPLQLGFEHLQVLPSTSQIFFV